MQTGDLSTLGYSYFTVTFSSTGPNNNGGYAALATVVFIVNGIPNVRLVSVGQGTEISGPADAITVSVIDDTPAAVNNAGQDYAVSVTVVPGTRASTSEPLFADPDGGLQQFLTAFGGASDTTTVPVPQAAGINAMWISATPVALPAAPANPNVLVQEVIGVDPTSLEPFQFGLSTPQAVLQPIAPGTTSLTLLNQDQTNAVVVSIMWIITG